MHKIINFLKHNNKYDEYEDDTYYDDDMTIQDGSFIIKNPKVIIIDETSMITGHLLNKFLNSYDKLDFKLILVGDYNQLLPFGSFGQPYLSIVKNNFCKIYELKENNRCNDSGLLKMFDSIKQGTFNSIQNIKVNNFEWYSGDINKVIEIYSRLRYNGVEPKNIRIITYSNKIVDTINEQCQLINKKYDSHLLIDHDTKYKINDILICTKNNYKMNIMNGHEGKIISVIECRKGIYEYILEINGTQIYIREISNENKKKRQIEITGYTINNITTNMDDLNNKDNKDANFKLGYAITCHKSQGSEYRYLLVYFDRNNPILNRKWLYTAVTRSKSNVYMICKSSDVDIIMNKKDNPICDWFNDFISGKYITNKISLSKKNNESYREMKARKLFENYVHPNPNIKILNYQQEIVNQDDQRYDGTLFFQYNNKNYILRLEYDGEQHFTGDSYQFTLDRQKEQRIFNEGQSLIRLFKIDDYSSLVITKIITLMTLGCQIIFQINVNNNNIDNHNKLYNIHVFNNSKTLIKTYTSYMDFII